MHNWMFALCLLLGVCFILFVFSFAARPAQALNAFIDPNGDGSLGNWVLIGSSDGSCAGGTYCDFIDDQEHSLGVPDTTDAVRAASNNGGSLVQRMSTVTGVGTVTAIEVFLYHNDGTNGQVIVELTNDAETASYGSFAYPQTGADQWDSHVFSVTLSQSQLDTLAVKLTANKNGGGQPADINVYALHADVTYSVGSDSFPVIDPPGVTNDGDVAAGSVITFSIPWSDAEGISSGYAVVCKEASGGGAPTSPTGWPPDCANGFWSDGPVTVSGTGSTALVPYTTVDPADIGTHNGYAFVCQAEGECSGTVIGTTDTQFTVNAPPTAGDLLEAQLSVSPVQENYALGEELAYTLDVFNYGGDTNATATNITVEVQFPGELRYDAGDTFGDCTPAPSGATGEALTCFFSSIGPGASASVMFDVLTAVGTNSNALTSAQITASDPTDTDTSNNQDNVYVTLCDPNTSCDNTPPQLLTHGATESGPWHPGPSLVWDDTITSISDYDGDAIDDVDVSVSGEATLVASDPPTARGTLVARPVDSRAANGIAPVKMSLFGDLPDTLRDPSFFARGFMWNPRTGPIGASCENIVAPLAPSNEPYDDNCTDSGHPSGEWRVGVDPDTGNYGGEITSVGPTEAHLLNTPIGWAWSDSVGWIAFSCDTPGAGGCGGAAGTWRVQEDVATPLSDGRPVNGWAWSPVIGWVSFDCTTSGTCGVWDDGAGSDADPQDDSAWIDENGVYHGWAWSSMVGWIVMNCDDPWVGGAYAGCGQTLSRAASGGYAQVELEIGTSNCPNGETNPPLCDASPGSWSWNGPYAFNDVGNINGLGSVFEADITADIANFWNTRYVRYRMTLCSFPDCGNLGTSNSPVIRGVSVLWAP